jgi:RimJ/RimL family protein N-acetyltransferase
VDAVELVLYSDADRWLTEEIECDPRMMRELGGAIRREEAAEAHRRRLATIADDPWWFKIVLHPEGQAAGMIGIWASEHDGEELDEVGWMVLPPLQGRGIATAALKLLLDRARSAPRFERIHAFPGISNAPSNALCRKVGFSLLGECEVRFRDRPLRCNHWELVLR